MRAYPRVIREQFHPIGKKQLRLRCIVRSCQETITRRVVIEYSWFRGEDGAPCYLCNRHGKKYRGKSSVPNPDYVSDKEFLEQSRHSETIGVMA